MEEPQRQPIALRGIALFEAAKGTLAFAAAFGLLQLRHTDLHAAADAFMLRHGMNPEMHRTRMFIDTLARVSHHQQAQIAGVALAYAAVRFAEAYGLWLGRHWAEWLAVISTGIYLPLEIWHFTHKPTPLNAGIIACNVALIFYLGKLLVQQRARSARRAG